MIDLPRMEAAQEEGWIALMELTERLADHWTLVGGQMVHLHCAERGARPIRPTIDLDAVLDVRAAPFVLREFTGVLADLGFASADVTESGHQVHWRRGDAQIDVLIPRHLGRRAESRRGFGGSPALPTPGAQRVLERTETVDVRVGGIAGRVRRPTLVGAIIAKSAAAAVLSDRGRSRHLEDVVVLSTLLGRGDRMVDLDLLSYRRIAAAHRRCLADPSLMLGVEGGEEGLDRLAVALAASRRSSEHGGSECPPQRRRPGR